MPSKFITFPSDPKDHCHCGTMHLCPGGLSNSTRAWETRSLTNCSAHSILAPLGQQKQHSQLFHHASRAAVIFKGLTASFLKSRNHHHYYATLAHTASPTACGWIESCSFPKEFRREVGLKGPVNCQEAASAFTQAPVTVRVSAPLSDIRDRHSVSQV